MNVCPHCGCPVDNKDVAEATPQQVEVTGVRVSKKSKKVIIIAIIIAVVVAIAAVVGIQFYKKYAAEKVSEEYESNLNAVAYSMLEDAATAEECGNLINSVWYNAIFEKSDDTTDKYTKPNGSFVSDFNDALQALFNDSDFSSDISEIESGQDTVQEYMKKLKNPPDQYKDAYAAISEMYDAYLSLTNLVIDPSGNLQTYSSNFSDADSEMVNSYNSTKVYLED